MPVRETATIVLTLFTQNRLTLFPEGGVPGPKFFLSTAKSMTIVTEQDTKGAVRAGEEGCDRTKLTELLPGNSNECELQRRVDADHVARLYVAFEPPRVDSLNA